MAEMVKQCSACGRKPVKFRVPFLGDIILVCPKCEVYVTGATFWSALREWNRASSGATNPAFNMDADQSHGKRSL